MKNRIPNNFFIVKGSGSDPYEKHAGSYHMALWDAGISDYNIMTYSSVLPNTSNLVSLDEIDLPPFGSEMYTIMSCAHGYYGESISAGIIFAWMYEDEDFTKKHGGLVCEVSGYYRVEELEEKLHTVLNNLYERTYKTKELYIGEPTVVTESHTVEERFGTALVSLCFIDYI